MKPFNIKEHLEHPEWKVVTREGEPVRILCTDLADDDYPVAAIVANFHVDKYTAGGLFQAGEETKYDLFFATERQQREGWVIIYKRPLLAGSFEIWPGIYDDRRKAEHIREANPWMIECSIVRIEWEEEQ